MNKSVNKIVNFHKALCEFEPMLDAPEVMSKLKNAYLLNNLLPLVKNSLEEILDYNGVIVENEILKGKLVSSYYEKAKLDEDEK